jgi:hypothetical protein
MGLAQFDLLEIATHQEGRTFTSFLISKMDVSNTFNPGTGMEDLLTFLSNFHASTLSG